MIKDLTSGRFCSVLLLMAAGQLAIPAQTRLILQARIDVALGDAKATDIRDLTVSPDGRVSVLAGDRGNPDVVPVVLRLRSENGVFVPLPKYSLRSSSATAIASSKDGNLIVSERFNDRPSDRRGAFRTIGPDGRILKESVTEGSIAAFAVIDSGLVWLGTDGTANHQSFQGAVSRHPLIVDRSGFQSNMIFRSAVSFVALPNGLVAAIERSNGKIHLGRVSDGTVETGILRNPSLERSKSIYANQTESLKKTLPVGAQLATPNPALSTDADENGDLFTLLSPHSQSQGATIIRTDSHGQSKGSYTIPLDVFPNQLFNPVYLKVNGGRFLLAARDGKIASYFWKE